MASIIETQNINNLEEGFTTAVRNPFPVGDPEEAQTYWNGYEYAAPGLGTVFNATTAADRLNTLGEEMFTDGSGEDQYGPVGRMSDSQTSILSGLADQLGTQAVGAGTFFAHKTGPLQMKATFKKSSALRSANISGRMGPGGQAISSGTPVPVFTDVLQYGENRTPELEVNMSTANANGAPTEMTTDGVPGAWTLDAFGDVNQDGSYDLADFFKWAQDVENFTGESGDQWARGGGLEVMNLSHKTLSNNAPGVLSLFNLAD